MATISSFRGPYAFLSNFHPSPIRVGDRTAPTVEHAFQAAKTFDDDKVRWILDADTPGKAKWRGKRVPLRPDWERVKLSVMEDALRQKFAPGSELAARLIATGDAELVEGNRWGDGFWGVSRGTGQNHLGRLLTRIRAELRDAGLRGA